jgi:hypothetical protein
MSTPNFKKVNASKYFAVETETDYDYDDLVMNLQSEFEKKDKYENDRSYPGKIVAGIEKNLGKWNVEVEIIVRGGYYSGCNLDWNVITTDQNSGDVYEYGDYEEKDLPTYINNWIGAKIKKVEKVFAQNSTPLYCRGIFSNGEAIYETCKN